MKSTSQRFSVSLDQLTEPTSVALAQAIERQMIATSLSDRAIDTSYVKQGTGVGQDSGAPILLHGFDSSVFEFRRLLPLLSEHQAWAVDLLGFGFTARSLQLRVSPAAIKAHLYGFWKQMIDQPIVLVGASMGGAAAIDFALTYPEAVQQLVLIDSAGFSGGPPLGKLMVQPLGHWATAFLRNPKVRQSISLRAYSNPDLASPDALQCAALHLGQDYWQQALISFTQSGGYRSFKDQLAQLQLPTLILWGSGDRILGTQDARRFQQAISQSQLIWIEHCGHVPHLEQPQQTAAHMLDSIRANSKQS